MTKEETKKASETMLAYVEGKTIQIRDKKDRDWHDVPPELELDWDFRRTFYRVKPECKYRPFESAKEFLAAQKEHGMYIEFSPRTFRFPTKVNSIGVAWFYNEKECDVCPFEFLLYHCKWQDGTPCGILEE